METAMKLKVTRIAFAVTATVLVHAASLAHDFSGDIAQFNKTAATKKMDSKEAIAARVALERSQGVMEQADVKMLLRIRGLTNAALRELGEQPGFLTSEMKRVETALAAPKTSDPAKIAKARELYQVLLAEKPAYDALENEGVESMKQALKLIDTAPNK
jgi:hypothetical protein